MCGIVGLISKNTNGFQADERDSFTDMLVMDQVRGMDGTGVFGVYHNRQCSTLKVGTNASNLIELPEYSKFETKVFNNFWAAFGHNRKATQGSISSKNSHPFVSNNIVLIHNGTLYNHKSIADTEVDSEAIAVALNDKAPEDLLGELYGAYALVWYDKRDKLIRVARNSERPLFIGEAAHSWIFSSEASIMMAAANRNALKIKDIQSIEVGTIFAFKNGMDYSHSKIKVKKSTYVYSEHYPNSCDYRGSRYGYKKDDDKENVIPFARREATLPPASRLALPVKENTPFPLSPEVKQAVDKLFETPAPSLLPANNQDLVYVVEEIYQCSRISPGGKNTVKGWEIKGKAGYRGDTLDVLGFCSWPQSLEELEDILSYSKDDMGQRWVIGRVVDSGTTTCGPWVKCDEISVPDFIEVWNTKTLPRPIWDYVTENCTCDKCASPILKHHAQFTSVNVGSLGKINKITCQSCVDEAVKLREKSNAPSDSTVQDQQQQQQIPLPTIHWT